MKIIDNKKDYYDYLSGVYGIDELIVFDRRGSVPLKKDLLIHYDMEALFSPKRLWSDKPLELKYRWNLKSIAKHQDAEKNKKRGWSRTWLEGSVYHYILEVGNTHYCFEVERWITHDNQDNANMDYRLIDTKQNIKQRISTVPICIIPCKVDFYWRSNMPEWKEYNGNIRKRIENPILSYTYIPKIIPEENIWKDIYDFLSLQREKPFADTRTDIQKLESAGFDKNTSFRNVK